MVDDFKGILEGFTPEEAYDEYDLRRGISFCNGWLHQGETKNEVGDFDLKELRDWCIKKLAERES
jgi:hypothetical protein